MLFNSRKQFLVTTFINHAQKFSINNILAKKQVV